MKRIEKNDPSKTALPRRLSRLVPWAVTVGALAFSAAGHAANGEADVFEARGLEPAQAATMSHPAVDTPVASWTPPAYSAEQAMTAMPTHPAVTPASHASQARSEPRTVQRTDVRESLATAQAANLMLRNGEIAEPQELMQAREDFIAMQTEQLRNEYFAAVAENERLARLEEERRAEAERIAQLVDEATDQIARRPEEVEIWVEPGTTVQELVSYIEKTGDPNAVAVLLVEEPSATAMEADPLDEAAPTQRNEAD